MHRHQVQGRIGEAAVAQYHIKQGFTLLASNYRQRYGEIDLIAQKRDLLVFVEVKQRSSTSIDFAELIPYSKQQKIIKVARRFIALFNHATKVCRFDVAFVEGEASVTYLENAFEVPR